MPASPSKAVARRRLTRPRCSSVEYPVEIPVARHEGDEVRQVHARRRLSQHRPRAPEIATGEEHHRLAFSSSGARPAPGRVHGPGPVVLRRSAEGREASGRARQPCIGGPGIQALALSAGASPPAPTGPTTARRPRAHGAGPRRRERGRGPWRRTRRRARGFGDAAVVVAQRAVSVRVLRVQGDSPVGRRARAISERRRGRSGRVG